MIYTKKFNEEYELESMLFNRKIYEEATINSIRILGKIFVKNNKNKA